MIRNVWTVLCKRFIEDKLTNNISLIDTINRIAIDLPEDAPSDVNIVLDARLATFWFNDSDDDITTKVRLNIVNPDGKKTEDVEQDITVLAKKYHRWMVNIHAIGIHGVGFYDFELRLKHPENNRWNLVASVPVEVIVKQIS